MAQSMLSNQPLTLKTTITTVMGTGATFEIFETGIVLTRASIVFRNKLQLERLVVDIATDGVCTIVLRGLDQSQTKTEVIGNKKERTSGAEGYITVLASDLLDVDNTGDEQVLTGNVKFTGNVDIDGNLNVDSTLTAGTLNLTNLSVSGKSKPVPKVADVTARNTLYPTPVDGNMVDVESVGLQYYKTSAGGWVTLDEGTPTPDATEAVKGKARIATQTEVDEGTSDTTIVTPLKLKNMIGFGDGSDGDVTIAGTVTLTRDMYYNNLVIPISTILNPNGYRIFVKGTLTGAGKIQRNGNAGSVGDGGVAPNPGGAGGSSLNQGSLNADIGGSPGGAGGSTSPGTAGTNGTASNPSYTNINGASGGAGGAGFSGAGAGGTGGTATRGDLYNAYLSLGKILGGLFFPASINQFATQYKTCGGAGGGGGGAGQVSAANTGGGGGGGGGNGGLIRLSAKEINRTGTFEAIGGAGGAGGASSNASFATGGGGGAGGDGGVVVVIYQTKTSLGTSTLTGGTGGAGGTGAIVGVAGSNGTAGVLIEIDV